MNSESLARLWLSRPGSLCGRPIGQAGHPLKYLCHQAFGEDSIRCLFEPLGWIIPALKERLKLFISGVDAKLDLTRAVPLASVEG